jgi:hypothetical protein
MTILILKPIETWGSSILRNPHLISFKGLASHALALKEEHAWLLVAASFRWMKSCN